MSADSRSHRLLLAHSELISSHLAGSSPTRLGRDISSPQLHVSVSLQHNLLSFTSRLLTQESMRIKRHVPHYMLNIIPP